MVQINNNRITMQLPRTVHKNSKQIGGTVNLARIRTKNLQMAVSGRYYN